jgi:hypothetical protein
MSPLAMLPLAAAAAATPSADAATQNELAHRFAGCIARSAAGEARAFLMMDSLSPGYNAALAAAINGPGAKCKKKAKGLTVGPAIFGGMIAEALLHARFQPTMAPDDLKVDPRTQRFTVQSVPDTLGLCTVAKAPAATAQLLATQPGSPAENRHVETLRTVVGTCVKPGTTVKASPPVLRSIVSLAAWRMVSAEKAR